MENKELTASVCDATGIQLEFSELASKWNYSVFNYFGFLFGEDAKMDFLKKSFDADKEGEQYLVLRKDDEIVSLVQLSYMDWESDFFAHKIGKLSRLMYSSNVTSADLEWFVTWINNYAKSIDYKMLYIKVSTKDYLSVQAFSVNKFVLTDTSLDYVVDCHKYLPDRVNTNLEIVEASISDLDDCKRMMELSFSEHFGRYNCDKKLKDKSKGVYPSWIEASLKGYADLVLLAKINGEVAGITVWKLPSELESVTNCSIGHYSIGAVHPEYSGNKVFHDLTAEGMLRMKNKGVQFIEGPTNVANHPVQSAYSKMGWKILGAKHCYHAWL